MIFTTQSYNFPTYKFYSTLLKAPFFSQLTNPHKSRLRLLILLQKKYLYTCKKLTKKPDLEEFVSKLLEQYRIENCGML